MTETGNGRPHSTQQGENARMGMIRIVKASIHTYVKEYPLKVKKKTLADRNDRQKTRVSKKKVHPASNYFRQV
jgi:hypothetical protein